jgi:uncharacterized phiE125 gp8 family phage protein
MTLKLITAPAAEPLTLTEAKLHLRVEHTTDDDLITALIQAARERAEHLLGRVLITQTWARVLDAFPAVEIELGLLPAQSITSITYVDAAGATQTLDSADYSLDSTTPLGWVLPSEDLDVWPTTLDTANAVTVTFVAGYGASGASVPAAIRAWMKMEIGTMYAHREGIVAGMSVADLPGGYHERLLDPYRVWRA